MKYTVTEDGRIHVNGHFGNSKSAGSLFRYDIFPDIDSIIDFLIDRQPNKIYYQSNNIQAHEYFIDDLQYIGWLGIGNRNDFEYDQIQSEIRNGKTIQFIQLESLPKTTAITIVSREIGNSNFQIITAFPGHYAPAFPHEKMSQSDLITAKTFWDSHILLKIGK